MPTLTQTPSRLRTIAKPAALGLLVVIVVVVVVYRKSRDPDVTIGVEGRRVVEIAGPRLSAAPFTPGDALAVRIADAQPTSAGFRYDLRYMAFGPGTHDLGKSLKRPDGTSPEQRGEFTVLVSALIPESYSGELYAAPASPIDLRTRYRLLMGLAWGVWAVLLVPLAWYGHKHRRRTTPPIPPPSIAERLRSLLEHAARDTLTVEQQVDLEQLLLAFWSNRLKLRDERLEDTVEQLRRHPQAGAQWNSVEGWFHSPVTPANGAVARQLLSELDALK